MGQARLTVLARARKWLKGWEPGKEPYGGQPSLCTRITTQHAPQRTHPSLRGGDPQLNGRNQHSDRWRAPSGRNQPLCL